MCICDMDVNPRFFLEQICFAAQHLPFYGVQWVLHIQITNDNNKSATCVQFTIKRDSTFSTPGYDKIWT